MDCSDFQTVQFQMQNVYQSSDFVEISLDDFDKICRICLSSNEIHSIFDLKYNDTAMLDLLLSCITLQIQVDDCLPKNICSLCAREIIQIHLFKEKSKQNEVLLRTVVNAHSVIENKAKAETEWNRHDTINDIDNSKMMEYNYADTNSLLKQKRIIKLKNQRKKVKCYKSGRTCFKCRNCSETYSTREGLIEHRKMAKHPEIRKHQCKVCGNMFTSSKLKAHMRAHTKEKPYKCNLCLQAFSMHGNLRRHMMIHTGERPHVCEVCGKGFIQATSLQKHKSVHENDEHVDSATSPKFVCSYCGKTFKRFASHSAHVKKHCSASDKKMDAPVFKEDTREHVCEICKRAYRTKQLLKVHQQTHGEKSFLCSECGKGFTRKAALLSHIKVHTGEKPYTCNICNKSFAHVGGFDNHVLTHTGERPHNCKICMKSFVQQSHLKYHLRTHSGEKPYSCSFCGKCFALKGNLTVHVRTHTGETPYMCPVCGKGFYDSSSMKKHRRGHGEMHFLSVSCVEADSRSDVLTNTD